MLKTAGLFFLCITKFHSKTVRDIKTRQQMRSKYKVGGHSTLPPISALPPMKNQELSFWTLTRRKDITVYKNSKASTLPCRTPEEAEQEIKDSISFFCIHMTEIPMSMLLDWPDLRE